MANLTFNSVSTYTDTAGTASAATTIPAPAGTASGKLMVLHGAVVVGSGSRTIDTPTGGATWIAGDVQQTVSIFGGGAIAYHRTWYKIAGGSEPANYGLTWDGAASCLVKVVCYDNPDTTTPYQAGSQVFTSNASGTSITLPSITTTNANEMLVAFVYSDGGGSGTTFTSAALTERSDSGSAVYDTLQTSAGASGTKLVTAAASGGNYGTMLAFNSAAGSGTAYTLTAALGTFSESGQAVNFPRGIVMGSALGTFALVGANSSSGYGMNAALGTFSHSGQDATLTYTPASGPVNYTLTSAVGAFVLAGQAALFTRAIRMTSDVGAFTLLGQSANLSWSAEVLTVNTSWRNLLGFTVSFSDSRLAAIFVDDNTPVPNTAVFMGAIAYTPGGRVYVCGYPSGGSAPQGIATIAGRSFRVDGAMVIRSVGGTEVTRIAGLAYTSLGELLANTSAPTRFPNGVGASESGVASLSHTA